MSILAERLRELVAMEFGEHEMTLRFADGAASAPYWWHPRLRDASPAQRANWELSGAGRHPLAGNRRGSLRGRHFGGAQGPRRVAPCELCVTIVA